MRGVNARRGAVAAGATAMSVVAAVAAGGCTPIGDQVRPGGGSGASAAPSGPVDPWTLPLEQRPPLYDACTELPPSALDAAGMPGAVQVERLRKVEPGRLIECAFRNKEILFGISSNWSSRKDMERNRATPITGERTIDNRTVLTYGTQADLNENCVFGIFSERGQLVAQASIDNALGNFNDRAGAKPCDALEQIVELTSPLLPKGDFA